MSTAHPSTGDLQRHFDGESVEAAVTRHVAECPECTSALAVMGDQRDALATLATGGGADWQAAAREAGRVALADLVHELAGACLAGRSASAPIEELPRPVDSLAAELSVLRTRLARIDLPVPEALPGPSEPVRASEALARRCLAALEALEGRSPRWHAVMALSNPRCD